MPNQEPAQTSQYPMQQDATDQNPVVNIPASAVPPQMANAPHPYEQQFTEIVVDGQKQTVDHAKLVELAQKGVSADSRFQEAAAKSKEADEAIRWKADMELVGETGDIGAFRRAGAAMGLSDEEIEDAARMVYETADGASSPGEKGPDENTRYELAEGIAAPPVGKVTVGQKLAMLEAELIKTKAQVENRTTKFGDLDEALQTAIVDVEQARVNKIIQIALDSDQVVSYYYSSYDDKGQKAIRGMIDEKVRGRLDASDGKFGDGAQILREVIPEVRETLEALGTPNRLTPQMGLGPAPGSQEASIYPTKPPDHVSSTEAGFDEHVTETLQHNLFKANQGGQ